MAKQEEGNQEAHVDRKSDERLSDLGFSRAENFAILSEKGICWLHWPDEEWTLSYYFSTRGQESFHIYFWLVKDFTWVQALYVEGIVFGTLAVVWQLFMMCKAMHKRSFEETVCATGMFFWLFGNYWWMLGELHDNQYPNEPSEYNKYAGQASYMLITAMVMVSVYYGLVKPFNLVPSNPRIDSEYDATGKDTAWNFEILPMWICFAIPTFLIAFDFMWVSLHAKRGVIDHAHYVAQFLWVFANAVWALGEFTVTPDHDEPIGVTAFNNPEAYKTSRWYSSWTVLAAFLPLVVMYCIWIPGSLLGKIEAPEEVNRLTTSHRMSQGGSTASTTVPEQGYRTSEVEMSAGQLSSSVNAVGGGDHGIKNPMTETARSAVENDTDGVVVDV